MQRGKNRTAEKATPTPMKIVTVENDQVQIEREIEKNIKKIRTLINKLRPAERQKYFNGLLSHILNEPMQTGRPSKNKTADSNDHGNLSIVELTLIEELSVKMEQLYRTMDHDPS